MNFLLLFYSHSPPSHRIRNFSFRAVLCCYYCLSFLFVCVTKKLEQKVWKNDREKKENEWKKKAKRKREIEKKSLRSIIVRLSSYTNYAHGGLIKFLQQSIWFRFWCLQHIHTHRPACVKVVVVEVVMVMVLLLLFLLFAHVSNVEKWIFSRFSLGYVYSMWKLWICMPK